MHLQTFAINPTGLEPVTCGSVDRRSPDVTIAHKEVTQNGDSHCLASCRNPATDNDDDKVLFYLPVTRNRICQFVLASVLIGHTYFRGVMETLETVFDYRDISLGTIHNIVAQAVIDARAINNA